MRWAEHVAHVGEGRGVHGVLVGRPEGKRPLGKPRCKWEEEIQKWEAEEEPKPRERDIYLTNKTL
jgi:hypothetical protein